MVWLKSYLELLLLVSIFPFAMPQIRNLSPLRGVLNTNLPDSFRTTTVSTVASADAGFGGVVGGGVGNRFPASFASQSPSPVFINSLNAPGALGSSGGTGGGGFGSGGGASFGAAAGFGGGEGNRFQASFASQSPSPGFGGASFGAAAGLGGGEGNRFQASFASQSPSPGFGGASFGAAASGGGFPAAGGGFAAAGDVAFDSGSASGSRRITADEVENALAMAFQMIGNRVRPQIQSVAAGGVAAGASAGAASSPEDSFQELLETEAPIPLEGTSMSHFGFRLTQRASEQETNCMGQPVEQASLFLRDRNNLTPAEALMNLTNVPLEKDMCLRQQRGPNCPNVISPTSGILCNHSAPYRSLDGSCNNLRNPEWGTSMRRFNRYLQPEYEDGLQIMRGEGRTIPLALPSARTVSAGLQLISRKPPREDLTMMVMQWGQYLDHDLTHTPEATRVDSDDSQDQLRCCEFGKTDFSSDDKECRPIDVSNDYMFREQNRSCMHFVRSLLASKGCSTGSLGPREQLNQLTSYLDASQVYGSDIETAEGLRTKYSGLLKVSQPPSVGHGAFLPRTHCIGAMPYEQHCYEAGDVRVNEQPALTSMHTLGLREHNNIASELTSINPSWDDERLYQETRAIVSALYQQITYGEFLPLVLGPDFMQDFQLNLRDQGYDNSYDSSIDATIVNVFATAAFRFGHTLIDEMFKGMGRNVTLRGNFDEPLVLNYQSTRPTALLHGLTACPTRGSDAFLTPTLVNHLLSKITDPVGLDLMSLNIQRGRDHGLQPYHAWRRYCGPVVSPVVSPVNSFQDLFGIMDSEAANVFRASYHRVTDIDLFPAGLAENTMPGGLLGPTFSCLLANQFMALKIGDRFWYENQHQPKPFTPGQLSALRQQSLASIMCQHLELNSLQPMAFRSDLVQGNQLQDCSTFPRLDLRFWSEDPINPPITPTKPGRYRPKVPCITPGTPKTHLNWYFPMCTPDLFIMNY